MSRSRNTKSILRAITSAKNDIIAEIQRVHKGNSPTTDFSSIQGPMTMNELEMSEQDDSNQYASKGPMTMDELINSIPVESVQYASKGPMTMNELDSSSPNDSPEIVLVAGRTRKQLKSRRIKHTRQSKSRKYRRNARK